jgi:SAM-dependent methyltransferase
MNDFSSKQDDLVGFQTLKAMSQAPKFNRWMYETIKPFLTGNILEIGSGIGNFAAFFIEDQQQISLSDIRKSYCNFLSKIFKDSNYVNNILQIDLVNVDFDQTYGHLFNQFDSIFSLNVVEHIQEDLVAIANMKKMLKTGGKMLILVPAYPKLFNSIDLSLQHFRRYKKNELESLLTKNGMKIEKSFFFNSLGIAAWWLTGVIFRRQRIVNRQMTAYDYLVPLAKMMDKILGSKIGLSVISVAVKE